MYPDDSLLVGVLNRKPDLDILLKDFWYRIPKKTMPNGVFTKYLAFFLSGTASKRFGTSAIYYFAEIKGVELVYRKDLFPNDNSEKAHDEYYKVQFRQVQGKNPPVLNPNKRRFAFIYTTWDRFVNAREIADLYSKNDYYVDRIYHALRERQIYAERSWDVECKQRGFGATVRIICENGALTAYTDSNYDDKNGFFLDNTQSHDTILNQIKAQIARMGGPISLPLGTSY